MFNDGVRCAVAVLGPSAPFAAHLSHTIDTVPGCVRTDKATGVSRISWFPGLAISETPSLGRKMGGSQSSSTINKLRILCVRSSQIVRRNQFLTQQCKIDCAEEILCLFLLLDQLEKNEYHCLL